MKARGAALGLLLISFLTGSLSETPPPRPRAPFAGGYRVLAADFHVHSFPLSWSALSPFDTVLEARRQGLDAIAMSGHGNVWVSLVGAWFSRLIGGPTVLPAEEVHSPQYHLIAVGIRRAVSWRQPASAAIADIHSQGGLAIAAHPAREYWPGFDAAAIGMLDAAEVVHPIVFSSPQSRADLRRFFAQHEMAAIGSSDFHSTGSIGLARTWVFAADASEGAILDALRRRRTVVYDRDGAVFGDPALIRLGAVPPLDAPRENWLQRVSRGTGVLGLLLAIVILRRE